MPTAPGGPVDEDGLNGNGLKSVQTLSITKPNVPERGRKALVRWVEHGGHPVLVDAADFVMMYR